MSSELEDYVLDHYRVTKNLLKQLTRHLEESGDTYGLDLANELSVASFEGQARLLELQSLALVQKKSGIGQTPVLRGDAL